MRVKTMHINIILLTLIPDYYLTFITTEAFISDRRWSFRRQYRQYILPTTVSPTVNCNCRHNSNCKDNAGLWNIIIFAYTQGNSIIGHDGLGMAIRLIERILNMKKWKGQRDWSSLPVYYVNKKFTTFIVMKLTISEMYCRWNNCR